MKFSLKIDVRSKDSAVLENFKGDCQNLCDITLKLDETTKLWDVVKMGAKEYNRKNGLTLKYGSAEVELDGKNPEVVQKNSNITLGVFIRNRDNNPDTGSKIIDINLRAK